ncbi:MAG TPA: PSD1 and planctomycete cytochrome C domain-containing protein [Verrucomicrobiales bacterium]|nr:PSD1 and planctomycete cytochrome C domain-containing protein [Verrucomicrobiales bacterium]
MAVRLPLTIAAALLAAAGAARAAEDPLAAFERDVRPLLKAQCFECHGGGKQRGGFRLDRKSGLLAGGDSEMPGIIEGKSAESHIIKRITSKDPEERMPLKKDALSAEQVNILKRWIDNGAHWPEEVEQPTEPAPASPKLVTAEDRTFWSFQPPQRSECKVESAWPRQPLDAFVFAKLREHRLEPSPEAPRAVLLRRVAFDLTGLPPSPAELDAFLEDSAKDAYEKAVDRLLASPRFGEHLASLWLPLARFAEDQAHQVGSDTKFFYPNAHLYRAWIIEAFNRDVPYDRFLKLQLAADRLPDVPPSDMAALGFLGLGPKYYNRNRLEVMADEWEDRVDTVSRTMLGLTVACARCHDHKFDPITTRDYYALAGIFASTRMMNRRPDGRPEKEGTMADKMDPGTVHVVKDGEVQNLNLFIRGNVERKGPLVPRRFLEVLSPGEPAVFKEGSGRRELADAIASRNNPLTARVFVNRVWAMMFGRPLVSSLSNFGHSGTAPSHPRLLDDLAVRFMEDGWSVKRLVRSMALSSTYRQTSIASAPQRQADPDNTLFSRMNRRRLTVEQWRDSALLLSGELVEARGGKSEEPDNPVSRHRTVYARISRLQLNDLLMQFDYPDANVHAEKRSVTTTPMQKLFALNSAFMQSRATALATRLQRLGETDADCITASYRLLFSREPEAEEIALAQEFLKKPAESAMSRWERYAQILLASNELLYVD